MMAFSFDQLELNASTNEPARQWRQDGERTRRYTRLSLKYCPIVDHSKVICGDSSKLSSLLAS